MIIDIVSDLHGFFPKLEGGDLLIVAGDLTAKGTLEQINRFKDWLLFNGTNLYKKIVMIAGNHDNWIQRGEFFNRDKDSWEHPYHSYLEDSGTEFEGLKIYGSPWTKTFPGMNPKCKAFTVDTEEELAEKWAMIPDDTDILITHSPPWGMMDKIEDYPNGKIENVGSKSLCHWNAVHAFSLKLHVFGHIHEGYGVWDVRKLQDGFNEMRTPIFVNASHVDENYKPKNKPIRIEL